MSDLTHDNLTRLKLYTGVINKYLIEETASLNVSTERLL
jgi:hypothetical protein